MYRLQWCPHFRGCCVQASVELGPEDVSLLERCPHFRGCYVQASMESGPEDVSLLERCPHFRYMLQWSWGLQMCPCFSTRLIRAPLPPLSLSLSLSPQYWVSNGKHELPHQAPDHARHSTETTEEDRRRKLRLLRYSPKGSSTGTQPAGE